MGQQMMKGVTGMVRADVGDVLNRWLWERRQAPVSKPVRKQMEQAASPLAPPALSIPERSADLTDPFAPAD
ncbi:MAG: hypothetical protein ACRDIU_00355 [Actinomycetota bacterium]